MSNPYADRFEFDADTRICGVSDAIGQGGDCRWPDGDVSWTIVSVIPGFTFEAMKAVVQTAFDRLAAVCGIVPRYTDTARTARIVINAASMDGPSGVLADSMLPCGNTRQCVQRYDSGEKWTIDDGPAAGRIDLTRVVAHELGHACGISHIGPGNLMSPTYSQTIIGPQAGDIAELRRRYGPPKSRPIPPIIPTNPTTPTIPTGGSFMGDFVKQMVLAFIKQWLEKAIADGTLVKILSDLLGKLNSGQIVTAQQMMDEVGSQATQALTAP